MKKIINYLNPALFLGILLTLLSVVVYLSEAVPVKSMGTVYVGGKAVYFAILFAVGGVIGIFLGVKQLIKSRRS